MTLDELYEYALDQIGVPYIWGGDGTADYSFGYDCSGLVQKLLFKAKLDPPLDQSADALYRYFLSRSRQMRGLGALAFFGKTEKIIHVGWCIDHKVMIHAGGGGAHVKTVKVAKNLNACVKLQRISYRNDLVAILMPSYTE